MMYYIYGLKNPITDKLFYVGKGKKSNNRHMDHLTERRGKDNKLRWEEICDIRKKDLEPIIEILADNILDEKEAYDTEATYIKYYGKRIDNTGILTNILDDARPPSWKGRKKSAEHRANLSKSHRGKKLSDETKRKIIETKTNNGTMISGMKGKKHSNETRLKISNSKTGVNMSVESSLKKSKKLKGKPWSEARRLASLTQRKTGPKSNG